jgi:ankyrin repeat protein
VQVRSAESVQLLLSRGADRKAINKNGESAEMLAAKSRSQAIRDLFNQ